MSEADVRIIIDKHLREAGWTLPGYEGKVNVRAEVTNRAGRADYVLSDSNKYPICVVEAKRDELNPLTGKEQAREYANDQNCRFVILSNGETHYFWDLEQGNPEVINGFPSPKKLSVIKEKFNPPRNEKEEIDEAYIVRTQNSKFKEYPEYKNEETRDAFIKKEKLRFLRDYQLEATKAVQRGVAENKNRFLLEMATGTGKTLTSSAIIKMFLRNYNVNRVLFLVDRIELEQQAKKAFDEVLKNDFETVIWKENKSDWNKAHIVVSTVQSFISKNKYKKLFDPDDFGLVISDEAHRSLGMNSRKVFEYFVGFKLGLTATPKDYLKSVDVDDMGGKDPRQLERRLLLDTYTTFGCEDSEPTFRYSLEDGVRDGFLVHPKVFDARSEITTELLSKSGYIISTVDEDGNDVEETFTQSDFEKKFFSENTNDAFCDAFLRNAKRDPYTDEIGKSLIFCVSQDHAAKVTQILNVMADKMSGTVFPGQYNSDFAVQVTSSVPGSQKMTVRFRNNDLNGKSKLNPHYLTSKTRVCVTVGMMTTGYDCTDILNICMMRPVYSPSEFIQMKGRGTRKHDFLEEWITKSEIPEDVDSVKDGFFLFDFFGNYEYFENEFNYDEKLSLPSGRPEPPEPPPLPQGIDQYHSNKPDPIISVKTTNIPTEGMRVDTDFFRSFRDLAVQDIVLTDFVKRQDFEEAGIYLNKKFFDKSEEPYTLPKLGKALQLDRKLTVRELLLYVFNLTNKIKLKDECMDEEFDKLDKALNPNDSIYNETRRVFEAYVTDSEFRDIIDKKNFAELENHPSGEAFDKLPAKLGDEISQYIKDNVDLERFESA